MGSLGLGCPKNLPHRVISTRDSMIIGIFSSRKKTKISLNWLYDDGEQIEPSYYIPIVPLILVNGADGVGNGFKSRILSYNLKDVTKALREIIKHGKVKSKLVPHINNWTGSFRRLSAKWF